MPHYYFRNVRGDLVDVRADDENRARSRACQKLHGDCPWPGGWIGLGLTLRSDADVGAEKAAAGALKTLPKVQLSKNSYFRVGS